MATHARAHELRHLMSRTPVHRRTDALLSNDAQWITDHTIRNTSVYCSFRGRGTDLPVSARQPIDDILVTAWRSGMDFRGQVFGAAFMLACSDAVAQSGPGAGSSDARGGTAPVPVPVEVALVDRYASMNLILAKPLAPASRWGVFHQSTIVAGHSGSATPDDLATQTLVTFAPAGGFRLTAGAFYATTPGVVATAGGQYLHAGPRWFVLLSPRVSLESDPAYSAFSIVRYQRGPRTGTRLYVEVQALNTFSAEEHIRSFQWLRLGADRRGTQFGLALNFDAEGRNPRTETSIGVFLRRPLF